MILSPVVRIVASLSLGLVFGCGSESEVLVNGLSDVNYFYADSRHLYWATDTSLERATLSGKERTKLEQDGAYLAEITSDEGRVYLTATNSIVSWTLEGEREVLAASQGWALSLGGPVAVDDAMVYFSLAVDSDSHYLAAGAKDAATIDSVSDVTVYYDMGKGYLDRLVVDSDSIYFVVEGLSIAGSRSADVIRVNKSDSEATVVAAGVLDLTGLAMDADFVYWTTEEALWRAAKSDGATTQLAEGHAKGLVLDAKYAYIPTSDGIARVAKKGGEFDVIIEGSTVRDLRVVGDKLYWLEGYSFDDEQSIHRGAKDGD